jgi:hypothetical protein
MAYAAIRLAGTARMGSKPYRIPRRLGRALLDFPSSHEEFRHIPRRAQSASVYPNERRASLVIRSIPRKALAPVEAPESA